MEGYLFWFRLWSKKFGAQMLISGLLISGCLLTDSVPNIHFKQTDIRQSDFPEGMFDVILALDVIEHIAKEECGEILTALYRLLKAGGYFIITTPNKKDLRSRFWGKKMNFKKHKEEYSLEEVEAFLKNGGFKILKKKGIYLPLPIPKIEHFANIIGIRNIFKFFVRFGEKFPRFSQTIWILAQK